MNDDILIRIEFTGEKLPDLEALYEAINTAVKPLGAEIGQAGPLLFILRALNTEEAHRAKGL